MKKHLWILLLVLNLLFLIGATIILKHFYNNVYRAIYFCYMTLFSTGIAVRVLLNDYSRLSPKKLGIKTQRIFLLVSCVLTVLSYSLFLAFLPKYTVQEAYSIIISDPSYASAEVTEMEIACITQNHGNPFVVNGYTFQCVSKESPNGRIYFDPVSGLYNYWKESEL